MERRFALAPMSGVIYVLTIVLVPWPLVTLAGAFLMPRPHERAIFLGMAVFLGVIWAVIWLLFRPSAFVVGPAGLAVEFPMRSLRVPAIELAGAFEASLTSLRERYGVSARVARAGFGAGSGGSGHKGAGWSTCTCRTRRAA